MNSSFSTAEGGDPVADIKRIVVDARVTQGDMLFGLERQRSRILKRTGSGVDAHGATFAPYSAAYAKRKAKFRDPLTVDLRGRNAPHMLQAMLVQGDANGGTIGFYDERAAMLAKVHNEGATIRTRLGRGKSGRKPKKGGAASFRMPKRNFFAATDEDLRAMENDIGSRIDLRLKGRTG